jgi:hypothetical protein
MRRPPRGNHLLTTAMVLFAVGLMALGVTFGLFASGHRRLPMWLSLSSLLLPLGLLLGMFGTRRQAGNRHNDSG